MAKCIQQGNIVRRVSDGEAARLVGEGNAKYVSKTLWKQSRKETSHAS